MCECADRIDEKLAEHNTRLVRAIVFSNSRNGNPNILLQTEQVESGRGKKKAVSMFPSYCPFCGNKYE